MIPVVPGSVQNRVQMKEKSGRGFPRPLRSRDTASMDQKLYLKVAMTDQRDTPVLPLSLLFSWMPGTSVSPEKV